MYHKGMPSIVDFYQKVAINLYINVPQLCTLSSFESIAKAEIERMFNTLHGVQLKFINVLIESWTINT
jgi:hypothetical protein